MAGLVQLVSKESLEILVHKALQVPLEAPAFLARKVI